MLLPLIAALLQLSSVLAAPTEPSVLSIPVRDIIRKDLSAHEVHPNFKLYTRWLETPQGSYIQRDPESAFAKHSNVAAIDCHSDKNTCLIVSRMAFADISNSELELNELKNALEAQSQTRDVNDPAELFARGIEKRDASASTLYSALHWKTYWTEQDESVSGSQHYMAWNLKCQTLDYSSDSFALTSQNVFPPSQGGITAQVQATLLRDTEPASTHSVLISITFSCSIFGNKCCRSSYYSKNYLGGVEQVVPKTEAMECYNAYDVSNANCDSFNPGWCGVHIRQYQKNEGPGLDLSSYRYDVSLYDNDQELIAERELMTVPTGQTGQVKSTLPFTFGVTSGAVDSDAVYMSYNGASWGSNDQDHHCNFGSYDSGHRDGDCGFTC